MGSVGLVLGGGGVTGAAYHFGSLFALEMATGWDPAEADVVVGTSSGAVVAALLRGGHLTLDTLVGDAHGRAELSDMMRNQFYRRTRPRGLVRWMRHGVLPGVRSPGLSLILGSPAPYTTEGIAEWIESRIGADLAAGWPDQPTVIVGYDLRGKRRVAFGTVDAPDVPLTSAVAASCAVPMIFEPVRIDGVLYCDGGIASGTSADLVLGHSGPLDLVIVVAPMAAAEARDGARFYEALLDEAGHVALTSEIEHIRSAWPTTDLIVLQPAPEVLETMRPNPMAASAAVPAFLRTLRSMRRKLASPAIWPILHKHLHRESRAAR